MATHLISITSLIQAPPQKIYNLIADYRSGHPRILPSPPFGNGIVIEKGGFGEGTRISYQLQSMGKWQTYHAEITEPKPGLELVETVEENGAVTIFLFNPANNGAYTELIISTAIQGSDGIFGKIEKWMIESFLRPIYLKEIELIKKVVLS